MRQDRALQLLAWLTLAAAALRFLTLDLQSFAHDESVTVERALRPGLVDTLWAVRNNERNGPVYYVLAWAWSRPFGTSEVGLRSLSAVFGTLTIPVVYLATSQLASRRAGLIAAGLVAVNPFLFWYSQEARPYALLVLLVAVALLFFARSLADPSRRNLALWAIASVLSFGTHYFAVFLVAPQGVWLLLRARSRLVLLAVGATVIASLPIAVLALKQQSGRDSFAGTAVADRVVDTVVRFAGGGEPQLGPTMDGLPVGQTSVILAAATGVIALAGVAMLVRERRTAERQGGLLAAALGAFALCAPVIVAVAGLNLIKHRNLIGALLLLVVAAAAGFAARRSGRLGLAAAAAMGLCFAFPLALQLLDPELQRRDVRGAVAALGPPGGSRLVLGPEEDDDPLLYYLRPDGQKLERPAGTVVVEEIALVSDSQRQIGSPAPGFYPLEEVTSSGYRIYRFGAPSERPVDLARLVADGVVEGNAAVVTEGAPSAP